MNTMSLILTALQAAIAARAAHDRMLTVLLVAVWGRIGRIRTKLERLIALWRAGILPVSRPFRARAARTSVRAPTGLPRVPGWLLVAVREAASVRAQLETLLSDDEWVEFLAAVPQAGRVLRPLCRMLLIGVAEVKGRKPRKVWQVPRPAPSLAAPAGLVLGPGGQLIYV